MKIYFVELFLREIQITIKIVMKKKFLLLGLSALLWGVGTRVQAEIKNGECGAEGTDVSWTLNTETGVLEISGTGAMKDFTSYDEAPWVDYSTVITSVTVGSGITAIGDYAFSDCTKLTNLRIEDCADTLNIKQEVFTNCPLNTVYLGRDINAIQRTGRLTIFTVPFQAKTSLVSLIIGNRVTAIAEGIFKDCTGLTSVTIPESVTTISGGAFEGCTGLTSITIGNSVTTIDGGAFWGCTGLTSVTIPESVTTIGSEAFHSCSGLTEIWFNADSCISGGFNHCEALTTVHIGENVKRIPDNAFQGCTGLTSVTIPESVTTIGFQAFHNCTGLKEITIPKSVTTIDYNAFHNCTGLTSVTIGNSVTTIGGGVFSGCRGLTEFKGKFATDDHCSLIVNDTLFIAFAPKCGVADYTIPNTVTIIDEEAFRVCTGLTSITIGKNVTSIGRYAFYYCTGLTSVTAYNPTPVNLNLAFGDVDCANCTLYVPAESVEKYQNTEGWKEFGTILPIDESSAITETQQEQEGITVYNLQGVLVLEADDASALGTLSAGAYIVNGKTMIIAR